MRHKKEKGIKSVQNCEFGEQSTQVPKDEGPWVQFIKGKIDIKVKIRGLEGLGI